MAVYKSIMSDGGRNLFFALVDDKTDKVETIDLKKWLKANVRDKSSKDSKERVIKAILRNEKQFNKKVDFNMWAKKTKPSFEQTMDYFMKNVFLSNITKKGIKVYEGVESVNEGKYNYKADALTAYFKGKIDAKELDRIARDDFKSGIATKKELSNFLSNKFTQDVMSDTYGIPAGTLIKRVRGLMKFAEGKDDGVPQGYKLTRESVNEANSRDEYDAKEFYGDYKLGIQLHKQFKGRFNKSKFQKTLNDLIQKSKRTESTIKIIGRELGLTPGQLNSYTSGPIIEDQEFIKDSTKKAEQLYKIFLSSNESVNEAELKLGVKYVNKQGKEGFIQTGGSKNPKNWFWYDGKNKHPYDKVKKELKPSKDQKKTGFGDYLKQGGRVWDNVNTEGESVNEATTKKIVIKVSELGKYDSYRDLFNRAWHLFVLRYVKQNNIKFKNFTEADYIVKKELKIPSSESRHYEDAARYLEDKGILVLKESVNEATTKKIVIKVSELGKYDSYRDLFNRAWHLFVLRYVKQNNIKFKNFTEADYIVKKELKIPSSESRHYEDAARYLEDKGILVLKESVNEAKFGYKDSTASYIKKHKDEYKQAEKMNKGNEMKFYDMLQQMEDKLGHPKTMLFISNALRGYGVDMYKDPKIKNPADAQEALFLLSK